MKIALIQLGDKEHSKDMLGCMHLNSLYCEKHGYDHIAEDRTFTHFNANQQKPYVLIKYIYKYDYIVWVDMDAFFVNHDILIEDIINKNPNKDIYYCDDPGSHQLNSGVLIFKNSRRSMDILWKWWESMPKKQMDGNWRRYGSDQDRLADLLLKEESPFDPWPRKEFNQHPRNFKAGDCLIHFMGYAPFDVKHHIEFIARADKGHEWNAKFLEALGQILPDVSQRKIKDGAFDLSLIDNKDVIKRIL